MEYTEAQWDRIQRLKFEIKELAARQKLIRPERKQSFTGVRVSKGYSNEHYYNRFELRHMHLVYGIMRGRTVLQMELKSRTVPQEWKLKELTEKYAQAICADAA